MFVARMKTPQAKSTELEPVLKNKSRALQDRTSPRQMPIQQKAKGRSPKESAQRAEGFEHRGAAKRTIKRERQRMYYKEGKQRGGVGSMIKRLMLLLIRFIKKAISPLFRRDAVFIRPVQRMPLPLLSDLVRCEAVYLALRRILKCHRFTPEAMIRCPKMERGQIIPTFTRNVLLGNKKKSRCKKKLQARSIRAEGFAAWVQNWRFSMYIWLPARGLLCGCCTICCTATAGR